MKLASLAVVLLCAQTASAREIGVGEVLAAAERASPQLKAAAAQEARARDAIEIGKSSYYPTLDAEAVQSYGFPGSNGGLGLGGIMSSPFRSGPSGGLVSRMTLFDLSRGYGLKAARSRLDAAQAETRVARYKVDQAALRIYFEGVRDRGQMEAWQEVDGQTLKVLAVVERFVRAGQHSPVDRFLVQEQADDAAMTAAAYARRYQIAVKRLALLTGLSEADLACPSPASVSESSIGVIMPGAAPPDIARAQAEAEAAKNVVGARSAGNYPTVTALASAGGMDSVRLAQRQDYSAGFAISLPLFEGFRVKSEISSAKDAATQRDYDVLAAKLDLAETDAAYDDLIETARIKLGFLDRELDEADQALDLALKRYLSFEGPLVDVRESLRDLGSVQSRRIDAKADLLFALGAKAVLDGGHVQEAGR
ncbi:MAG TPA: TolC family protein [Elusimicrobiota bacterium]|nr:TolC family protein [Elusimicrobiota bacterium]